MKVSAKFCHNYDIFILLVLVSWPVPYIFALQESKSLSTAADGEKPYLVNRLSIILLFIIMIQLVHNISLVLDSAQYFTQCSWCV